PSHSRSSSAATPARHPPPAGHRPLAALLWRTLLSSDADPKPRTRGEVARPKTWHAMTGDQSHPLPSQRPSPVSENSEEARDFLQSRVALFWRVIFFIILFASGLGAVGAVKKPGVDLLLTLVSAAQAGIFWWLCRRGERSIRFSQLMEGGGLLLNSSIGAVLG